MARGRHRPNVVSWYDVEQDDAVPGRNPGFYDSKILAEGDSWFTLGGLPTSNLLFSMRFHNSMMIANCGTPGDTIRRMSEISRNRAYKEALSAGFGYPWDLILLSGGGNDLIDDADEILIPEHERTVSDIRAPADYCDQRRIAQLVDEVQEGYRRLVAVRDRDGSPARGKPIVTHTYDYATPRNSPARFLFVPLLGPWLYKALTETGVPERDWVAVSDYLAKRLADAIVALQKGPGRLPNFHVVDTLGTLTRARPGSIGESGDWMNEIHPDFDGYAKLARKLDEKVASLLGS